MKAAVFYWSASGNTEMVAEAIRDTLEEGGVEVLYRRVEEAGSLDFFDFDLVALGFPSYQWHPPKPMDDFLKARHKAHERQGRILTGSPRVPGKHALIFCTYSGPHTGLDEATPAGKYAGQFFEHVGITVLDELYVVGEFRDSEERSTQGRLGDIRGRPNEGDLAEVRSRVLAVLDQVHR
jgi:hypothetical protein